MKLTSHNKAHAMLGVGFILMRSTANFKYLIPRRYFIYQNQNSI